jgi:hypothetical protein
MLSRPKKIIILLCLALSLSGCDILSFGRTSIGEIISNPGQFEDQTVTVRGKVTDVTKLPLVELKSFTLRDRSGEIIVQTTGTLPPLNKKTTIRARVKTMAIIDGKGIGLRLTQVE